MVLAERLRSSDHHKLLAQSALTFTTAAHSAIFAHAVRTGCPARAACPPGALQGGSSGFSLIFGPGNGREDRGVTGCPFGFRRSTPSPSRDRKESPYSGHAIEREGKSAKNSVFGAESISPLQLQNDAQNANFGPQSHLNMKLNPRRMLFRSMMTPKGSELI